MFELINPPSVPPEHIVWKFKGHREVVIITFSNGAAVTHLDYANRTTLDNTTASLELRDLILSDTGEYIVNLTSNGVQQLKNISLNVFGKNPTSALLKVMKQIWHLDHFMILNVVMYRIYK